MALRGSIEDVPIVDVLQFVHLSKKSGALTLTSPRGPASVEFNEGDIVFARSPATRTLGELLVEKGFVSEADLDTAIRQQQSDARPLPIGQILLTRGLIGREVLVENVKQQIQAAMMDIINIQSGEFQFDQAPVEVGDGIRLDAADVLPILRLNTQFMVMEAMRAFDEQRHASEETTQREAPETPQMPRAPFPPPPRIVVEATLPPNSPLLSRRPTAREPRRAHGEIVLVDFEKPLMQYFVGHLKDGGYQVRVHVPARQIEEHLLGTRTWPSSMIVIWRVRADAPAKLRASQQADRLRLLEALKRRHPGWRMLMLVSGWDGGLVAELYAQGVRAALPFDAPVETDDSPSLRALRAVIDQLLAEHARAAEAQAAELRAWLQAKSVTTEMQRAVQRAAIALELMRVAASTFERAALFLAKGEDLIGLGAFGFTMVGQPMAESLRGLALSVKASTRLARCLDERVAIAAPTRDLGMGQLFFDTAGYPIVDRGALVPLVGTSRVIGVLYGDNGLKSSPLRSLHAIELSASQAGLAYENALLRIRLDAHRAPEPALAAVSAA